MAAEHSGTSETRRTVRDRTMSDGRTLDVARGRKREREREREKLKSERDFDTKKDPGETQEHVET